MKLKEILTLREEVNEGMMRRKFYGIAYFDWDRDVKVYYPIPLNILIKTSRNIYFWLMRFWPSYYDRIKEKSFERGWAKGFKALQNTERDKCNNCIITTIHTERDVIIELFRKRLKEERGK